MPKLINEKREYQRLLHSEKEQKQLASKGFEAVYSSNVSAIARDGVNLLIRFHGGATYSYRNKGKDYDRIMGSASKGKWVWRFLIRPKVPYNRVSGVIIKNDVPSRDMMEERPKPKFKVEAIVPTEVDRMKGALPQIRIAPLDKATKLVSKTQQIVNQKVSIPTLDKFVFSDEMKEEDISNKIIKTLKSNSPIKEVKIVNKGRIQKSVIEKSVSQLDKLNVEYKSSVDRLKFGESDLKNTNGQCSVKIGEGNVEIQIEGTTPLKYLKERYKDDVQRAKQTDNFKVIVDEENLEIYTITHEYGHSFHSYKFTDTLKEFADEEEPVWVFHKAIKKINRNYKKEYNKLDKEIKKIRKEKGYDVTYTEDYRNLIKKRKKVYISNYANTNMEEFIAEAFTDAKLSSNPSPYSLKVLEAIDNYKKR